MKFDLTRYWYQPSLHPISISLLPFSWLFGICATIRRWLYRVGMRHIKAFHAPIIVVGNITVGGTGKTPFVIWLAHLLQKNGYRPGIVSRGVGGKRQITPHWVNSNDSPHDVGDEAKLLYKHTNCKVVICIDRASAVSDLLQHSNCDIVICDDGLQHYRLARDIEIAIVDGERRFGNHCLLPAGPLRESVKRLNQVDWVIVNGGSEHENKMQLEPMQLISLKQNLSMSLAAFTSKKIHAVAGIGHPERFFTLLKQAGFDIIPHVFPDHYLFTHKDLQFNDSLPIIMTEKDAVKCVEFANENCWYLPVAAKIDFELEQEILAKLKSL